MAYDARFPNGPDEQPPPYRLSFAVSLRLPVVLLGLCGLHCVAVADTPAPRQVVHRVQLTYATADQARAVLRSLVECRDKTGKPTQYYCDTTSVYCADGKCQETTVRVYWDALGDYLRFELPPGAKLEKAEGKLFTDADYRKLDLILHDLQSPLRNMTLVTLHDEQVREADVDAVATATPGYFQKSVVKGAAWTCLTLWHTAHGTMRHKIRRITAARYEADELRRLLNRSDWRFHRFAIEELTSRRIFDRATVEHVLPVATRDGGRLLAPAINYIRAAPDDQYYRGIAYLLGSENRRIRLSALNELRQSRRQFPGSCTELLAKFLGGDRSYQEVDQVLRLCEDRHESSTVTVDAGLRLLEHENLLIARRAYWFLTRVHLTPEQHRRVDRFRQDHADIL